MNSKNANIFHKNVMFLTGLKWLSLCLCCLGLTLGFVQTPRQQADQIFTQGMAYLNRAQSGDLSSAARSALLKNAKEVFETALSLNPDHDSAWKALGHTLQQSGDMLEADLAYNTAAHLKGVPVYSSVQSEREPQELMFVQLSNQALR